MADQKRPTSKRYPKELKDSAVRRGYEQTQCPSSLIGDGPGRRRCNVQPPDCCLRRFGRSIIRARHDQEGDLSNGSSALCDKDVDRLVASIHEVDHGAAAD